MFVRRIIIADEQVLFRVGVAHEIERMADLRLVGSGGNAHDAIRLIRENRPHLALLSDSLPGITGGTLARELQRFWPTIAMGLFVEGSDDPAAPGVWTMTRRIGTVQLARTVREMARFQRRLGTGEFEQWPRSHGVTDQSGLLSISQPLSTKEIEVLDCVAHGFSNKEIGGALSLTEQTVKNHLTSVFRKLGVNDRVQAVLKAAQLGWVDLSPAPQAPRNERLTS